MGWQHVFMKKLNFHFPFLLQCASFRPPPFSFFFFLNKPANLINHPSVVRNLINAPPYKIPQPTACSGGVEGVGRGQSSPVLALTPAWPFVMRFTARTKESQWSVVTGFRAIRLSQLVSRGGTDRGKVFPGQGSAKMPHARSSVTWPSAILDDSWARTTLT